MRFKPISLAIHGVLDYLSVPLLLVAGPLFDFDGRPAVITSTAAGAVLVYSAFTAYPLGLVKLVPPKAHRAIDIVVGLMFVALPWVMNFSAVNPARNFFVVYGVGSLIAVMLTDFRVGDA
ncbi:MAG TPA: hypothetical protein VHM24_06230 [Gemmatimonadaceae bacterium]|nr:hypothetical protein [Gemmatimonadaceae bacterium]